ncbi:F-box only protein 5 isoform X2 [Channa argus]|uniref:F-box only protein 5 isoform X2 n=1 Tax=Channa argus TaxID=215402 RepID=UPI0035225F59
MKYARYEATRPSNTEKTSAAESKMLHPKASPVKDPIPIKSQCPPASVTTVLPSLNNDSRATHNKENSASKNFERTLDERFEDSGYMSLHNSQIDDWHGSEEDDHVHGKSQFLAYAAHQEQIISPNNSPSKCQGKPYYGRPVSLVAASTPVDRPRRKTAASSFSSTPSDNHRNPNLPILNFQRAVCEELEKGYRRNKRNMRSILTNILTLLGDLDLISCKKVSRTWKKIICEDTLALRRCTKAEEALWESRSSQRQKGCGLTRDAAVSRVVLSCMQNLASSSTQSSLSTSTSSSSSASTPGCKVQRRTSQKGGAPISRLSEYVQVASSLKQHESLRQCKLCGSPATHLAKAQRATCTRSSCLFDFCTRCQEAFHGSTPCRTVQPRSSKATTILPGSAHSKRNIRRL